MNDSIYKKSRQLKARKEKEIQAAIIEFLKRNKTALI
jgi:hypothetical protein